MLSSFCVSARLSSPSASLGGWRSSLQKKTPNTAKNNSPTHSISGNTCPPAFVTGVGAGGGLGTENKLLNATSVAVPSSFSKVSLRSEKFVVVAFTPHVRKFRYCSRRFPCDTAASLTARYLSVPIVVYRLVSFTSEESAPKSSG